MPRSGIAIPRYINTEDFMAAVDFLSVREDVDTDLGAMVGTGAGLLDAGAGYVFFSHWLYYLLAVVGMSAFGGRLLRRIISLPESETARTVVAGILFFGMMAISVAFLVTETYQPFLYFRF